MKIKYFIILIVLFVSIMHGEIEYKISGKTIFNGNGKRSIKISVNKINSRYSKIIKSDNNGEFQIYLKSGTYKFIIDGRDGYISKDILKMISIKNKNIKNVIFILEKVSSISGRVILSDDTPITTAHILVKNRRGVYSGNTDENGNYLINGIRSSDKTTVIAIPMGASRMQINDLICEEGKTLENIDFIIENKLLLKGKIISKETKIGIKHVFLYISSESSNEVMNSVTDNNGYFKVYNLKIGTHNIVAFHPDFDQYNTIISIKSNELKNITIELKENEEN